MSNLSQHTKSDNNLFFNKSFKNKKEEIENNNYSKNTSTSLYNDIHSSSRYIKPNNSSINLLNRNLLSINNSHFDHLKKVKSQATIFQLDKNDNNYLDPLAIYSYKNNEIKENQKRNNINSLEWLNIVKHKIFSVDVNSKIKSGKNISRNEFYEEKNKNIKILKNYKLDNKNKKENKIINSYQFMNISKINEGSDYKFNTKLSMDNIFNCKRFKKDSEELNKKKMNIDEFINRDKNENIDHWKKIKLKKNKSMNSSLDEESIKNLKSNYLYFDKDLKINLRNKNWWKINK